MDIFTYLMVRKGHNLSYNNDLVSYLIAKDKTGTYTTKEGLEIIVNNSLIATIKDWEFSGNSSQFSTTGKNLLPITNQDFTFNGVRFQAINGKLKVSGTASANITGFIMRDNNCFPIMLDAGTYYLSRNLTNTTIGLLGQTGGEPVASLASTSTAKSVSFTLTETTQLYFFFYIPNGTTKDDTFEIMVSTNDGDWEPYTDGPAPNPDYPYPVKTVTGENSLKIQNKNLFDGARENIYFNNSNQFFERADALTTNFISAKEGDKFTISTEIASNGIVIASFDENYNCLLRSASGASSLTLTHTCPAGTKFIIGSNYIGMTTNTQLEKGLIATPYVPHEEQNYQLSLGNIELCKVGGYQDYIYKSGDNWYKKQVIGKVVLDGTQTINKNSGDSSNYLYYYVANDRLGSTNLISNKLAYTALANINGGNASDKVGISYIANVSNKSIYFNIGYYLSANTINDVKNYLASNNITVYYVLATPQDIPITDTTLINQLNNIYNNAHSYNGVTNITSTYEDGNEQMYLKLKIKTMN